MLYQRLDSKKAEEDLCKLAKQKDRAALDVVGYG